MPPFIVKLSKLLVFLNIVLIDKKRKPFRMKIQLHVKYFYTLILIKETPYYKTDSPTIFDATNPFQHKDFLFFNLTYSGIHVTFIYKKRSSPLTH